MLVHEFGLEGEIVHLLMEEDAERNSWFSPDHQNLLIHRHLLAFPLPKKEYTIYLEPPNG